MTRRPWTSESERAWLSNWIPDFLEAQQKKTTSTFWPKVYQSYANAFEIPDPTTDEVTAANGDTAVAVQRKEKAIQKHIFHWFHNNTRANSSLVAKQQVIPLKKSKKRAAPWQVYQKTYWNKLKPIVDKEYNDYLNSLQKGEKVKVKIQFQAEVVRREYENETPETKAEIEALTAQEGKEDGDENKPAKFQEGVDRVFKTLTTYLKTLEDATGWSFFVFGGGPNPHLRGKITTVIYETAANQSFANVVGANEWAEVVKKWDEYLFKVYPEDVRKERALSPAKSDSPAPSTSDYVASPTPANAAAEILHEGPMPTVSITSDANPPDQASASRSDGLGASAPTPTADSNAPAPEQPPASEAESHEAPQTTVAALSRSELVQRRLAYEEQKAKNIAENKARFEAIFGKDVWGGDGPRSQERKDRTTKAAASSVSVSVSAESTVNPTSNIPGCESLSSPTPNSTTPASTGACLQVVEQAKEGEGPQESRCTGSTESLPTAPALDEGMPVDSLEESSQAATSEAAENKDPTMISAGLSQDTDTNMRVDDGTPAASLVGADAAPVVDNLPLRGTFQEPESNPSTLSQASSDDPPCDASLGLREAATQPPCNHLVDLCAPSDGTTQGVSGAQNDGKDGESDKCKEVPHAQQTPVPFIPTTGYVTDEKSFAKLIARCNAKNWVPLVEKWIGFEKAIRNNTSLPTKFRPQEIAWWMKNNRKLNRFPKIIRPADYITTWRQWWCSLQPDWRNVNSSWPPSRTIPDGGHLSGFAYSGPNGFFLVLLSLSWWGKLVADGLADAAEFETAVDDVFWILSHIVSGIPLSPSKRPRDDDVVAKPRSKHTRKSV